MRKFVTLVDNKVVGLWSTDDPESSPHSSEDWMDVTSQPNATEINLDWIYSEVLNTFSAPTS